MNGPMTYRTTDWPHMPVQPQRQPHGERALRLRTLLSRRRAGRRTTHPARTRR